MTDLQQDTEPGSPSAPPPALRRKATIAATLGHVIEYYDYTIYAVMAAVIAPLFFASQSATAALLSTFALFAVPFLARPIGGIIFGHYGDRLGRKTVLVITISMMGVCCGLIGALPTYATVGVLAPILLALLRILQGISQGGEVGGAVTYIVESAPPGKRGLFGSALGIGPTVGVALAAGVALILNTSLTTAEIAAWGWRLPFLLALPLAGIALYMRWKLEDSPVFLQAKAARKVSEAPLKLTVTRDRSTLFKVIGLSVAQSVGGYVATVFVVTYMSKNLGYSAGLASGLTSFGLLAVAALLPLIGSLSDRIGRKPVIYAAQIGYIVLTVPALLLMGVGNTALAIVGFFVLNIPNALTQAVSYTVYAEVFPTNARYSGVSIGFGIGVMVGGATPFLATLLIASTGDVLVPGYLVMAVSLIAFVCLRSLHETGKSALAG